MLSGLIFNRGQLRVVHESRSLPCNRSHQLMVYIGVLLWGEVALEIQHPEYTSGLILSAGAPSRFSQPAKRNADDLVDVLCEDALRNSAYRRQSIRHQELIRAFDRLAHYGLRSRRRRCQDMSCRVPAERQLQNAFGVRQKAIAT